MGQLAALFSEMADGLSEHPGSLRLVGRGGAAKAPMTRSSCGLRSGQALKRFRPCWRAGSNYLLRASLRPSVFPQP